MVRVLTISPINNHIFREWGRIRNVYEGPDGSLYIMTNNRDGRGRPSPADDRIFRLVPKRRE